MTFAEVANYLLEMHWKNITNAARNQPKDEFITDSKEMTQEEIEELISWKDESPIQKSPIN